MRPWRAIVVLALLAGCVPDPLGRGPGELRAEEQRCVAAGGRWAPGGASGAMTCFLPTGDGGKLCRRAGDCESLCLAGEAAGPGHCAAERPLLGCLDMLDEAGARTTICID